MYLSIANVLWEIINKDSEVKFQFSMVEIEAETELKQFYSEFINDERSIGFNVALPWKVHTSSLVDQIDLPENFPRIINTVYKKNEVTHADNTDIIGIKNGLLYLDIDLKNIESVLVLGMGGAGTATSTYFAQLQKSVYCYDINPFEIDNIKASKLTSIEEVLQRKYDLIINATPVGKYHFDKINDSFSSPLGLEMVRKITKPTSILQEMNYFPVKTLFLEIGETLGLTVVSGTLMLVFQALESYNKYFGKELSNEQIHSIIGEVIQYVDQKENSLFKLVTK